MEATCASSHEWRGGGMTVSRGDVPSRRAFLYASEWSRFAWLESQALEMTAEECMLPLEEQASLLEKAGIELGPRRFVACLPITAKKTKLQDRSGYG